VNCDTYIADYLSAHADGELSGDELRAADEHLAGCAECRQRMEEERALKQMLRAHAASLKAPAALRMKLFAALDTAEASAGSAAALPGRSASTTRLRARVWIPAAIAAVLLVAFFTARGRFAGGPSVPTFDVAIAKLQSFEKHFEPNVPSASAAEISDAYMDHKMPGYIWNFNGAGYRLVGGRVDHLPDGRPATFTFYRSGSDAILCTYVEIVGFAPPTGSAAEGGGHVFYRYRGYSICVTRLPKDHFYCILISRRPVQEFVQVVGVNF
jgi:Putative zinc-finger